MKTKHKTDATAKARLPAPLSLCGAQTALKYLHALMAEMGSVSKVEMATFTLPVQRHTGSQTSQ